MNISMSFAKKEHLHWTVSKIETRRTEKGKLWQYQTITTEEGLGHPTVLC